MGIYEKLTLIQNELKAPKNSYNSFGKYKYRSCEDILEGLKPVLKKHKATLTLSDEITQIGDRYYVKVTATFTDAEDGTTITNTAYARESDDKKGMDASQVTGATSSYARKYALNGLFLIDDTKDADTDEYQNQQTKSNKKTAQKTEEQLNQEMVDSVDPDLVPSGKGMTPERLARIQSEMTRTGINLKTVLSMAKVKELSEIKEETYIAIINKFAVTPTKETKE